MPSLRFAASGRGNGRAADARQMGDLTMKMVMAIINRDDASVVVQQLTKSGYQVNKLATTGGFLRTGNTTILIGVDDEKVQHVISIITKHSNSRKQLMPAADMGTGVYANMSIEVMVGGAAIFVLNVEHFEKV